MDFPHVVIGRFYEHIEPIEAEPVLSRLPIAQNARVVIRHGKQSPNPREVRIPRQQA